METRLTPANPPRQRQQAPGRVPARARTTARTADTRPPVAPGAIRRSAPGGRARPRIRRWGTAAPGRPSFVAKAATGLADTDIGRDRGTARARRRRRPPASSARGWPAARTLAAGHQQAERDVLGDVGPEQQLVVCSEHAWSSQQLGHRDGPGDAAPGWPVVPACDAPRPGSQPAGSPPRRGRPRRAPRPSRCWTESAWPNLLASNGWAAGRSPRQLSSAGLSPLCATRGGRGWAVGLEFAPDGLSRGTQLVAKILPSPEARKPSPVKDGSGA